MRKSVLAVLTLFVLAAVATHASAQTMYTTTTDSCGGKANQYCRMSVTDQANQPFDLIIDNRYAGTGLIGRLQINYPYPGDVVFSVTGTFTGFVSNPDGTRNDFYSTATYVSNDGMVNATFNYRAYYQRTCSGRGCGGTLGWHYLILAGSTVEVQ